MKYCVEVKQANQPASAYWHTKEFDTKQGAEAYMERLREVDREYGQERDWNYRISRVK